MPYKISWIIKHRLIVQHISGELNPSEIHELTALLADHLKEASTHGYNNIPAIFDMSDIKGDLPEQALTTIEIKDFMSALDPRLLNIKRGFLVLIAPSERVSNYVSIINKIFTQPMTTVHTMAEALDIIKHMYPKLGKLLD